MNLTRPAVPLETKVPRRRATIFAPFRFHDFRLLWFGLAISNFGTWMQITTLGYIVVAFAQPSAALGSLYLGILGVSSAVPVVLISPLAGVVADRFPKRWILFLTNGTQVAIAVVLAILATLHALQLWEIFVLTAARSTVQAFDAPARQSWVPLLVPREFFGNAIGLNSIAFNAPSVVGPPIAGILIAGVGEAVSFYVNAVATTAVIVALILMAPSPPSSSAREGVFASIGTGLRFLFLHSVLRQVLVLLVITSLLVRPYTQLLPAYAAHVVHVDARGYGILFAAAGFGGILGALVTAIVGAHRRAVVWLVSALAMAVGAIVLGLVQNFAVALVALVFVGMSAISFAGSSNILLQTLSPDEMRGRAISVFSMIILGLVPAGSLLLGSLASGVGLSHAIVTGGAISLLAAVWIYASDPQLRRV